MKIFLLIIFLLISSCRWFSDAELPYSFGFGFRVPPGSPSFQQGFRDGCSQIFYSRGNIFYRFVHKYNYNPKMNGNIEYRFGYKRGGSYCFNFIVGGISSSDRMLFPHKDPILAGNIEGTGFVGEGVSQIIAVPGGGFDDMFKVWAGGGGDSALGANPLWAGGSSGQFFGQ